MNILIVLKHIHTSAMTSKKSKPLIVTNPALYGSIGVGIIFFSFTRRPSVAGSFFVKRHLTRMNLFNKPGFIGEDLRFYSVAESGYCLPGQRSMYTSRLGHRAYIPTQIIPEKYPRHKKEMSILAYPANPEQDMDGFAKYARMMVNKEMQGYPISIEDTMVSRCEETVYKIVAEVGPQNLKEKEHALLKNITQDLEPMGLTLPSFGITF
jgi:hypothetical protein